MARKNDYAYSRMSDMVTRYGELCTHERAALILGVAPRTVRAMVQDGRLRRVGKRIDVRSICEYIENPVIMKSMKSYVLNRLDLYKDHQPFFYS